jgi:hypothetical protein
MGCCGIKVTSWAALTPLIPLRRVSRISSRLDEETAAMAAAEAKVYFD